MIYIKNKIFLKIGIVLLSIALLIVIIALIFLYNIEKKAYSYLTKKVVEKTNGLYNLEIKDVDINVFNETLNLKGVKLNYNHESLDSMIKNSAQPAYIYEGDINRINIKIYDLINGIRNNDLKIESIDIKKPKVTANNYHYINYDDSIKKESVFKSNFIDDLKINEINISNGTFYYYLINNSKDTVEYVFEDYSLSVQNLKIDSYFNINNLFAFYDYFSVQIGRFNYELKNYNLNFKNIDLNIKDSLIHLDSLIIVPKYKKYDFAYTTGSPSVIRGSISDIDIVNINIFKFINTKGFLHIDSVHINNFDLYNYKNKNIPPTEVVKPLFHHIIQKLPIHINVPIIEINNGHVIHEELGKGRNNSGYIEFSNMDIKIIGLTNILQNDTQNYTFNGNATFMNSGDLHLSLTLPINPKSEEFNVNGYIKHLDLTEINTIIKPASNMSIESGNLNAVYFNMNGNNVNATMDMLMLYDGLEVALLSESNKKKHLLSELANDLIIINSNPLKHEEERNVRVTVTRNLYLYEFNFIWLGLFDAMKESIGFTEKRQDEIKFLQQTLESLKPDPEKAVDKKMEKIKQKEAKEEKKAKRKRRKATRKQVVERIKN